MALHPSGSPDDRASKSAILLLARDTASPILAPCAADVGSSLLVGCWAGVAAPFDFTLSLQSPANGCKREIIHQNLMAG